MGGKVGRREGGKKEEKEKGMAKDKESKLDLTSIFCHYFAL